jgi:hypothetical protein
MAGLVIAFTAFTVGLPPIIAILMFIIFPPTFIVFLVGLAFIQFGVADAMTGERRDVDKERARKRALGYDE